MAELNKYRGMKRIYPAQQIERTENPMMQAFRIFRPFGVFAHSPSERLPSRSKTPQSVNQLCHRLSQSIKLIPLTAFSPVLANPAFSGQMEPSAAVAYLPALSMCRHAWSGLSDVSCRGVVLIPGRGMPVRAGATVINVSVQSPKVEWFRRKHGGHA